MLARRWALFPLGLWAVSRLNLLLLGYVSVGHVHAFNRPSSSMTLAPYPALDALCRWDCGWFEKLAIEGWTEARHTNFWPGFPLLARALSWATTIPVAYCLLIISNLAALAMYLVLYVLFSRVDGEPAARWALIVLVAFPFSFFHAAGYPETLMILTSAASVLLAIERRPFAAGTALGLGVLCRHLTILYGGALVAAQIKQRGLRGLLRSPQVLALGLPFALAGVYMTWQWRRFGDPLWFWKARDTWGGTAWWGLPAVIKAARGYPHIAALTVFALVPTVGAFALLRRRTAELAAAALPLMLVLWAIGGFGLGRYSASCWPAFLPLGRWLERRPALQVPLVLTLAIAQGWFFFLHTHHFEVE